MAITSQSSGTAVAGYFATGQEAHRAINALIDQGFTAEEIGAAFHVGSAAAGASGEHGDHVIGDTPLSERSPNVGGSLREELGTTLHNTTTHSNSLSSAASGSNQVQFGNLGPGSGTVFDGAGKPGPIPGSDLNNTGLPSELASTLPHDADVAAGHTGSWANHMAPVFHRHADKSMAAQQKKEEQDFGTGEGMLNLSTPRRYSREGFEQSFSGYGVQPDHARNLSGRIGHGGAVVTVHAGARAAEAEQILESHGGQVRYSPGAVNDVENGTGEVEVFGTIGRDYPTYF